MEKVYEIIKQSLDNCTRMTEASKVDEATRVANKIVKLKDNPVPSIDKVIDDVITFINVNKDYHNVSAKSKTKMLDSLYLMLNTLQNGVETNKEQPKLNEEELQEVEEALLTFSDEDFAEKVLKYLT